jgi:hypothetical protein
MPINKEFISTLHNISHFLEIPDAILSHNQNKNLSYKVTAPNITFHEHKILDLLDNLIKTNNENNDSNNQDVVISKIDKHFHLSKYKVSKLFETKSSYVIDVYKEKEKALFYKKIKIPPKKLTIQLS